MRKRIPSKENNKMQKFQEYKNKKGINALMMILFIILLSVASTVSYNIWFNKYVSELEADIESRDLVPPRINKIIYEKLYFFNPTDHEILVETVMIDKKNCNIKPTNAPIGLSEIVINDCAMNLAKMPNEVVLITEEGLYTQWFNLNFKIPPGAIFGGSDCAQLYKIRENMSGHYHLRGDINCFDTKDWNNGSGFDPIGNTSIPFTGSLNGGGYTIYNLYMNHSDKETGMFSVLDGATVQNLNFDLLQINGIKKSSGALAGFAQNSIITNVRVKGDITGERKSVGGVVGELQNSTMSGCSYENGTVTGDRKSVGGLVGFLDNSEIHNSFSTGDVYGIKEASGGLVGAQKDSIITYSFSTGDIYSGDGTEGGLIGTSLGGTITNSYWDINTSGQPTSAGGIGLTTAQMQEDITYAGWDPLIWQIADGTYPYFR